MGQRMHISLIAAMARHRVIGKDNGLPWRLPADLKHFKTVTLGKPVIMGRKTFESIGKPLPGRTNIVVTRDPAFAAEGCDIAHSLDAAIAAAGDVPEAMIIGGANLYAQALPRATRLYLTLIDVEVEGDAWFPDYNKDEWREVECVAGTQDDNNHHPHRFVVMERQ